MTTGALTPPEPAEGTEAEDDGVASFRAPASGAERVIEESVLPEDDCLRRLDEKGGGGNAEKVFLERIGLKGTAGALPGGGGGAIDILGKEGFQGKQV